jgi:hypothetical protein
LEQAREFGKKEKFFLDKMPVVECKCGEKILVVPDVVVMGEAVKKHVQAHKECDERFLSQEIIKSLSRSILQP